MNKVSDIDPNVAVYYCSSNIASVMYIFFFTFITHLLYLLFVNNKGARDKKHRKKNAVYRVKSS